VVNYPCFVRHLRRARPAQWCVLVPLFFIEAFFVKLDIPLFPYRRGMYRLPLISFICAVRPALSLILIPQSRSLIPFILISNTS